MILPTLVCRSLLRDRARAFCALFGIAAATGLLVWNLGLAETAQSQSAAAVRKASAPYGAWATGVAGDGLKVAGSRPDGMRGPRPEGAPDGMRGFRPEGAPDGMRGPRPEGTLDGMRGPRPDAEEPATRNDLPATRNSQPATRNASPTSTPHEYAAPPRRFGGMRLFEFPGEFLSALPDGAVTLQVLNVQMDGRTSGGTAVQGPPMMVSVTDVQPGWTRPPFDFAPLSADTPPEVFAELSSADAQAAKIPGAVFSESLFGRRAPRPEIGSIQTLILGRGTVQLRVAGFFEGEGKVGFPTVYTTSAAMVKIRILSPQYRLSLPNLALLPEGTDSAALAKTFGETVKITTRRDVEERFRTDAVANLVKSLPLSLSLAVITAIAMLVTVLTAGISAERRRLALLRCAGLTRGGVARLIALETVILSVVGWVAGLLLATGMLQIFLWTEASAEIPSTVHVGGLTIGASFALALFAALCAVFVPMRQAARVRPLEALDEPSAAPRSVRPRALLLGLVLLCPILAIGFAMDADANLRTGLMIGIGLPCYVAGSLLLIHPLMRLVEIVFLRPLGALLALDSTLLSRRLSRAPGRALGTILTVSLGLGAFLAIRTWGGTLMSSYVPSPEWPDNIVSLLPEGIPSAAAETAIADLTAGENAPCSAVLPIEATQIAFDPDFAASAFAKEKSPRNGMPSRGTGVLLLFGTDPERTFGGDDPFFAPRYVEGSRAETLVAFAAGDDACVIPAMLSRQTGLHKGSRLPLADGSSLRVAGVLDFNWHMVTSRSQVRTRFASSSERRGGGMVPTIGMAFCSESFARRVAQEPDAVRFLWCRFSPSFLALDPYDAALRTEEAVKASVASADDGLRTLAGAAVQSHLRDEIADGTLSHGNDILGTMARIPLWSLFVTCTGLAALLVASARATRKETDTMRAIGLTRGQLARLFLGEATLVILCTLVLSLLGGLLLGWSFAEITRVNMRAGLPVRFIVPWLEVLRGLGLTILLSFLFAIVPLRRIVR